MRADGLFRHFRSESTRRRARSRARRRQCTAQDDWLIESQSRQVAKTQVNERGNAHIGSQETDSLSFVFSLCDLASLRLCVGEQRAWHAGGYHDNPTHCGSRSGVDILAPAGCRAPGGPRGGEEGDDLLLEGSLHRRGLPVGVQRRPQAQGRGREGRDRHRVGPTAGNAVGRRSVRAAVRSHRR
jgi:hypothetical protein